MGKKSNPFAIKPRKNLKLGGDLVKLGVGLAFVGVGVQAIKGATSQ